MKFELDRLMDYDDGEILAEIRRVATLVPNGALSRTAFDEHSRVSSKTVRRRFGTWEGALSRAGLGERYSGKAVTEKQLQPVGRQTTNDELLGELRAIAKKVTATRAPRRWRTHHARRVAAGTRRARGSPLSFA